MSADDKLQTIARLFAGRFEIRESLPWNGLALVYAATGLMHRDLAVAVLPLDCESSPEQSRRFHQTFERLRAEPQLPTPPIHDVGIQRGVPFVAWEREDGVLLADMVEGAMPVEGALELIEQVLVALEAVHALDLHHGDLTPRNVLLQPDGVRLLGLGIAPLLRGVGPDVTGPTGRGSGPKARRYLAPEILQNRLTGPNAPGPASDIYAVGALLHRLLTGVAPGGELSAEGQARLDENPELRTAIERAMATEALDRPTASELRRMLAEGAEAKPSTLPPAAEPAASAAPSTPASAPAAPPPAAATPPKASGGGALKWVAALAALLALGGAAFVALGGMAPEDPDTDSESESESDSESASESASESDSESDSASEAHSESESESESASESDSESDSASDSASESDSESDSASEAHSDPTDPLDSLGASGPLVGLSDPFLIEELARIEERGARYEQEDFRRIYGWIARHSGDVRGHLVLARAYAERGWHRAVVESYEEALGVDAEAAKEDPLILRHLIDAYLNGSDPVMATAWPLLRRHWGADAVAGLDAIEAEELRPALRRRLRSLRSRVERLAD